MWGWILLALAVAAVIYWLVVPRKLQTLSNEQGITTRNWKGRNPVDSAEDPRDLSDIGRGTAAAASDRRIPERQHPPKQET